MSHVHIITLHRLNHRESLHPLTRRCTHSTVVDEKETWAHVHTWSLRFVTKTASSHVALTTLEQKGHLINSFAQVIWHEVMLQDTAAAAGLSQHPWAALTTPGYINEPVSYLPATTW